MQDAVHPFRGCSVDLLDWLAIGLYAAAVLAIGLRAGVGHGSAEDLTLGGRKLPAWAVLGSTVGTELSAATFVGVPHAAYTGDWFYLQLAFGALLAKGVLATRVLPLYHRLRVVTVYGFLELRFGPHARRAAALCFVGGRLLASGVRLFIAALAFAAVTGWSIDATIVVCGAVAATYTLAGGIRAVVWTDTLQAGVFVLAAGAALAVLAGAVEGGLPGIFAWAAPAERARVFHLEPLFALADARPLGVALAGGFFLTLATHATDYDMVQRLLTTRDARGAGRALAGSALLNFPLTALFLLIGTGLACFYAVPPDYPIDDARRIFPIFALHELPAGVRGLLFAGLFAAAMSSLDSAICALATTWTADVRPGRGDGPAAGRRIRLASLAFAALLIGAALLMARYQRALASSDTAAPLSLVDVALSAMTLLYGGLLGVFAWGLLTRRRGSDASAVVGLAVGALIGTALFLHPIVLGETLVAWPWWIPIGATAALAVTAVGRGSRRAAIL